MPSIPHLPPRDPAGHKGTFGTVGVIGGQCAPPRVMVGGPALTAAAALRSGAGLAVLAVPKPLMAAALTIAPSATGLALPVDGDGRLQPSAAAAVIDEHLAGADCLAIGPGLGADEPQQQVIMRLVARDDVPLVIDADAINALAAVRRFDSDFAAHAIMTPHPGEFARIAAALQLDADPKDPGRRPAAAEALARRLGCVVVLKGASTVVSDGIETAVNETGNAALATAGTGDVLTGMIAGLIAQHFRPAGFGGAPRAGGLSLLQCARLAVHAHGLAADRWAAQHGTSGMLASDLLEEIPLALGQMRGL